MNFPSLPAGYVSYKYAADVLEMDRSHLCKLISKLSVKRHKFLDEQRNTCGCMTAADLDRLGFSDNIANRMLTYATLCPTAKLVKTWPCKRNWEKAVIAQAVTSEYQQLGPEVFDAPSIGHILARLDSIFALFSE